MKHSAKPKKLFARLRLSLAICAPLYLSVACASDNVVVKPVSLAPIAPGLMAGMKPPACDLPDKPAYTGSELAASGKCWSAAYGAAVGRLHGLQRAVKAREKALAGIVKK